jgi:hypothetical protein
MRTRTRVNSRRWLVTAPHLRPPNGDGRQPWGDKHARVDSSSRTACGLPAVTWYVFWTLEFNPLDLETCPNCIKVLAHDYLDSAP